MSKKGQEYAEFRNFCASRPDIPDWPLAPDGGRNHAERRQALCFTEGQNLVHGFLPDSFVPDDAFDRLMRAYFELGFDQAHHKAALLQPAQTGRKNEVRGNERNIGHYHIQSFGNEVGIDGAQIDAFAGNDARVVAQALMKLGMAYILRHRHALHRTGADSR